SSYHYESRIALALTGEFICFLPEEVARPYVEKGDLKAIAQQHKHFTLGAAVVYKQVKKPNRAKTLFLETIYQYFGNSTEIPPY
ncbi:MAG: LysR family transcriptional regulator, partial [Oceanospirillum sp.]|nr:LysR family transcriptional regulator [Oceanospirillum sp.]